MFQGTKTLKELNYGEFPFNPERVDALLLTHAHIDHSGLIPKLVLGGFRGPVFATPETRDLCAVLLPDAGVIQEIEVQHLNRRRRRRARQDIAPIYTSADAVESLSRFSAVPLMEWRRITSDVRARWWNAGHILGSASIELEIERERGEEPMRLCFSGDIGPGGRGIADDPEGPGQADHIIVESTYGDVEREPVSPDARRSLLAAELAAAHAAGGPLLIPAFAVERTQELLVDLLDLMERTAAPPGPIFLDSPLAIRATDVFLRKGRLDSGENPFAGLRESRLLRFTESAAESREIERQKGWHIIIAASGMCDAGRVRGHLRRLLPREEATVLIVGFQAVGTLGRLLLDGRKNVRIQGDEIAVRAAIREIDAYSGHADARGLVAWTHARLPGQGTVFLNHGEQQNLEGLRRRLISSGLAPERVVISKLDQSWRLDRGSPAIAMERAQPRIAPDAVNRLDWHNARIAFLEDLRDTLEGLPDDQARERLLKRLTDDLMGDGGRSAG
jgi:metallo-beta-lactamase family protein